MISKLIIAVLSLLIIWVYKSSKIRYSPRLWLIYGKKGSGKSTLLAKIAIQMIKQGHNVYSTDPIKGTLPISIDNYYEYRYPKGSVIIIDEIGMVHDNRGFKSFRPQTRDWYKLQRHMGVMVVACSQTADIDLKIRNLADDISIVRRITSLVSMVRYYERRIVVARHGDGEGGQLKGSEIVDDVYPRNVLSGFLFSAGWRYWRYFDSYSVPNWPLDIREMPPPPVKLRRSFRLKGSISSLKAVARKPLLKAAAEKEKPPEGG